MSTGGLSPTRLERLREVLARHVREGAVPGLVAVVARGPDVHVEVLGATAFGGAELQRDAIFRITSMTKPVTAVATMVLVEECRLRLDDPVDDLLPELADRRVLARLDGPVDDTVPAQRPITVRDLLTFRLGYGLVFAPPGTYPVQAAIDALDLAPGPPIPRTPLDPDEWMRALGTLPLLAQPGAQWMYNAGAHLLGVLIARASGQSLPSFLRERIFEPLGMVDTSFTVPPGDLGRLVTSYVGDASGAPVVADDPADSVWSRPPAFPDGAAGLVSTADDYLSFGRMLLGGGRLGRERILSRPAVELLSTDQLTAAQKAASTWVPGFFERQGWGFGVAVQTRRDDLGSIGRYGWDGGFGTSWANDPAEGLVGVLMTQQALSGPAGNVVFQDFWTSAYQALED